MGDTGSINLDRFFSDVLGRVYARWFQLVPKLSGYPKIADSAKLGSENVQVEFSVLRDGTVKEVRLKCSTGNDGLDEVALESIPLTVQRLPKKYQGTKLQLRFSFLYKTDKNGLIPLG